MTRSNIAWWLAGLLVWCGLFVAFSVLLNARGDFQIWLYPLEGIAWTCATFLARWAGGALLKKQSIWVVRGAVAVMAIWVLFPLAILAFGSALELCAAIRSMTGPLRPISAQYFFNEFTGLRLDNGLRESGRNVPVAMLWGLYFALALAPFLFGASALLWKRRAIPAPGN